MQFNFPWFSLIYLAGSVLILVLALIVRRRPFAPGVVPFTYLLLSMMLWTLIAGLEAGAIKLPLKIIFAKAEYIAVVSSGALSLTFILQYTHSPWISRRRNLILLWIIPVLSLALVWTNELHGLVWSKIYLNTDMNPPISVWEHGPLYWLVPIYQYLLYFSGIVILWGYGLRNRVYLPQVSWLLAGSLVPVAGSIVYVTGGSPIKGFDLTPISICIMGGVYAITILHFRFMDILPAATTTFVKTLPDGFLLLDPAGRIASLNPATERILGQKTSPAGQRLSQIWPELDKICVDNLSKQHIKLTRDQPGAKSYLDVSIESFFDKNEAPVSKLIIIRDITELKQTQLQLEEEINKRSQFTRSIVHELRNPLTAITSSSAMLEDQRQLNEEMRTALVRNIQRASLDLEQRVNELFELARGELGLLEIKPEKVDMNQLIQEISTETGPTAAKKGIKIVFQASEMPCEVWGDKNRLRQVLSNLLGNALRYTDQGQITIRCLHHGEDLLLTQIEDSGRGIEKDVLDNLFDPYLRSTKEKSRSTGLGIGLALSKKYVELHKGEIWAESIAGKGTTISFVIPLFKAVNENKPS